MKQGGQRNKGNKFERDIAFDVTEHFCMPKKACYRTPLSGGHPYGAQGDLVIAPALFARFPFCTECKHQKVFSLDAIMKQNVNVMSYFEQCVSATMKGEHSLVVAKGKTGSLTYAFIRVRNVRLLRRDWRSRASTYGVIPTKKFGRWYFFIWPEFLKLLKLSKVKR